MKHFSLMLVMVLFAVSTAFAQRTITGTVMLSDEGEAIGATVVVADNEGVGTTTEFDGTFSLSVPNEAKALRISYTGYASQTVSIEGVNTVNVTLQLDDEVLGEVVVIGYETVKRSDVTAAVSEVKGEALQEVPVGNVENLLQGKSSGLSVVGSNGKPGGDAYVRIRGVGSFAASNQPLYVVDGAQVTGTYMNAINPNDIEDVTVLKDAAATSIYGSSGSNGVILVTTRKGAKKPGARPEIRFSTQYGVKQKTPDNFEMMNAQQKIDYEIELFDRFGLGNATRVAAYKDATTNYKDSLLAISGDWQDILLQNGTFNSYNLSMGGMSDKVSYFASVGYYDEEGITKASRFNRMTASFNTEYKAADWLTLGSKLNAARTYSNDLRDRYNVQNPFNAMYTYNAYESEYLLTAPNLDSIKLDDDGNPEWNRTHQGFSISEALLNNIEDRRSFQLNGQLFASFEIIKNLTFRTQINGNMWMQRRVYFNKPGSILDGYIYGFGNPTGSTVLRNYRRYNYQWNNILTYKHTLNEKHNLSYLLGHEFYDYDYYYSYVRGQGFPNGEQSLIENAATVNRGGGTHNEEAKLSFFGKVGYNYMSKYLASFTYRVDGSSSFGINNRYGHFFAGSVAWNIHMEDFAASAFGDKVDQLKLRLSAGTSGNDTGANSYQRLGVVSAPSYAGSTAIANNRPVSKNLRWESNFSSSLGVDFGLFNNRVTGALDLYTRTTSDLLMAAPKDQQSGIEGQSILTNVGKFVNRGIEFELDVDVLRLPEEDFNWSVYGNVSLNENEVLELADLDADPNTPTEIIRDGRSVIKEGEEYYTFYLVRFAGVDPATGDELFYDKNGNVTNVYKASDAVALSGKSIMPKYYGSFGTVVDYKGISLGVDFYYNVGNYIYNQAYMQDLISDGASLASNQRLEANNFWRKPGDITDVPRPTQESNRSDRFLQKGDYLRLKNVRLGYTIPVKSKWVSSVNIFGQASNLKTWTKFDGDPEVGIGSDESDLVTPGQMTGYSYPQTRGFTVGLNLTF